MAKEPKLDYDAIETLYQYGYNTKEIAVLVKSVNGHISKVLRGLGVSMRKRGEIVDKTNFYDMDSEAQTLLKGFKEDLDEIYQSWFRRPSVQKRLTGVPSVTSAVTGRMSPKPNEEAVVQVAQLVQELAEKTPLVVEPIVGMVAETYANEEAVQEPQEEPGKQEQDVPTVEEPQVEPVREEEVQATQEDKYQLEEEKTEEGYAIVRGADFKGADLQVQGAVIKHFMNKGMAQRPIATELGIAQSNISRIWTKYRKAYVK